MRRYEIGIDICIGGASASCAWIDLSFLFYFLFYILLAKGNDRRANAQTRKSKEIVKVE